MFGEGEAAEGDVECGFVGSQAVEHGERGSGDFVRRVEQVFEDFLAEELESSCVVGDGVAVDEVVPLLHVDLELLLAADFIGQLALLVVPVQFRLGDFDAELSSDRRWPNFAFN